MLVCMCRVVLFSVYLDCLILAMKKALAVLLEQQETFSMP